MVILKRIKGSTLMETMVATVLIVIIFMVASLIMNSLMAAQANSNVSPIKERLRHLEYKYVSQELPMPYSENWQGWDIEMLPKGAIIHITATHSELSKSVNVQIAK